ncbi:MAG: restriction endonuclease subunit S [Bacteroidales bacterium]|nr:restriction endonuclease subunit S [Bacteroidales bacterium]
MKTLGDILSVKHGKDYKGQSNQIGKYPVMGTGGIITYIDSFMCDWECVCIGRKGTINKPIYMSEPFWSVDTLFFTQPQKGENPKFQYYLFETINWLLHNEASGVPSLSASVIANIKKAIPTIQEQNKIAAFFTVIDTLINKQNNLVESLKLYKRGVSEAIFSKKINFGCSNASWDFYTMEDLGYFYNGLSGKGKGDFGTGNSEFITYMNVYKNPISEITMCEVVNVSENEKQNKVQYGDVLFSQSSETLEEVGMSSVWLHETTPYLNSFCFGFRFHNPENIYPLYIAYYMRSQEIRRGIMREGQGATRINLSAERMKGLQLALPDIESQKKIGNFLFCFDKQIINAEAILNETLELRKSLLQKMFI